MIDPDKQPLLYKATAPVIFLLFLLTGLLLVDDYGMAWDEPAQRHIGIMNVVYMNGHDSSNLLNSIDRYHGPAFEMILYLLELAFDIDDLRNIYLFRHYVNFLLFFFGAVAFYYLLLDRFRSMPVALLGFFFLVCSPRIFGESFYNSKDLAFLSLALISLFTHVRLINRPGIWRALLHGLACGMLTDIRLTGIILPAITAGSFLILHMGRVKTHLLPLIVFLISASGAIYAMWPVLWHDPVRELFGAFSQLSKFPWDGPVLYLGATVNATQLPWHYLFTWIGISSPLLILMLFLPGFVTCLESVFRNSMRTPESVKDCGVALFLIIPVLSVLFFKPVLYDGWRHMYFVYVPVLYFAVHGFCFFYKIIKQLIKNIKIARPLTVLLILTGMAGPLHAMVGMHPFQMLYFNRLAGKDMHEIRRTFEVDYWGLTFRSAIEYIAAHEKKEKIFICGYGGPVELGAVLLPAETRNRFVFIDSCDYADYLVTNYRWHPEDFNDSSIHSFFYDQEELMSVFRSETYLHENFVLTYANNYESPDPEWKIDPRGLVALEHDQHNQAENMYGMEYSATLSLRGIPQLAAPGKKFALVSFRFNLDHRHSDPSVVISVDDSTGKNVYWKSTSVRPETKWRKGRWKQKQMLIKFPSQIPLDHRIKIYIYNYSQAAFLVDDLEVEIFGRPAR